jgi:hypothetical protein
VQARRAQALAARRGKLRAEDVLFAMRHDARKLLKAEYLLVKSREIAAAKRGLDTRDDDDDDMDG